ncbi:hypothetical protein [Pseudoalteromonas sp. D48-MNA-CIBAN-0056]|uniref:hypothetical protein n=1 Tax=Pseudoalteromonas sp. D48-MNA-CIBAN-0056 TaxID=3140417 RepID=UPI00331A6F65
MKKGFEIIADLGEAGVKSHLLTGVAKDIPYISTLIKIWNLRDSIRDRMFAAKVMRFLESFDDVTGKEREEMSDKIKYANKEDLNSVTDKIIFCIESITDIDKSEFIANLYIAYIYEKISESELRRCTDIVQMSFLDDLKNFINTGTGQYCNEEELEYNKILGLINTPLIVPFRDDHFLNRINDTDNLGKPLFKETDIARSFRHAFWFGKEKREAENA